MKELQEMMRDSETGNVLREHNLDDPKYCDLCSHGIALITKLYTDIPVSGKSGERKEKREGKTMTCDDRSYRTPACELRLV